MKKQLLLFLILPLTIVSCAKHNSFEDVKARVNGIEVTDKHPYYQVLGSIDYNGKYQTVNEEFINNPDGNNFVPNVRYTTGYYNEVAQDIFDSSNKQEANMTIFMMSSRSYWLRAPLKIDKTNFYTVLPNGKVNSTCASANLEKLICFWLGKGTNNPSSKKPYYDLLSDGGFAIGGEEVHTKFKIDNHPYYPDPERHPDVLGDWDFEFDPLPVYKETFEGRVNIRFEYDKDGWLKREYVATVDYDFNSKTKAQLALESRYYYRENTEKW